VKDSPVRVHQRAVSLGTVWSWLEAVSIEEVKNATIPQNGFFKKFSFCL